MFRKGIALFLLSIFMLSVTTPAIVSLLDGNAEISFLIDNNEEESKENESAKDVETKIVNLSSSNLSLCGIVLSNLNGFYLKKYAKPYVNLISPPPKYSIV